MSNIINAVGFNDPEIQVIRSQVSTMNDGIPCLLFPVKVETRFMKADKPVVEPDAFPEMLAKLFDADNYMRFNPEILPSHEVLGKIRRLHNSFEDIKNITGNVTRITGQDKDKLQTKLVQIEKTHKNLSRHLSRIHWNDAGIMNDLRILKNKMAGKMQLVRTGIESLKPEDKPVFLKTSGFLEALEDINDAFQKIGRTKLSFRDRNEKKLAFTVLDSQIVKINNAIKACREYMSMNLQAARSQLKRLDELKKELDGLYTQGRKNTGTIRSPYKKSEYRDILSRITGKVRVIYEEIDWRVKPKIEMRNILKTIDARDVIWKAHEIGFYLKQINRSPFRTFDEIKNTSQKLIKKLNLLSGRLHWIVEGNDEEIKAISKAWDDADTELERFTSRIKTFKGAGGQKDGLKEITRQINDECRKDLAGLKSTSKSHFPVLNNSNLEKSAISYSIALKKLRDIQGEIERNMENPASGEFTDTLKKVVEFQPAFASLLREMHILPGKTFRELTKVSAKLEAGISGFVSSKAKMARFDENTRTLGQQAVKAAVGINSAARSQYCDDAERKRSMSGKERSPIVFSKSTVTHDELWVRFYPDDIAIHTHEEPLTAEEIDAGKAYWMEIWAANDDYESKLSAWRAITTAYGTQRSAWIVRTMEPQESAVNTIKEKLRLFSKKTLQVIDNLEKISKKLANEQDAGNSIAILGQVYPLLNLVEGNIKQIDEDQVGLLLKTQNLLIKIQSQINRIIRSFQRTSLTSGTITQQEKEVINQVIFTFSRITKSFQKIRKLSSNEILNNEAGPHVFPEVETRESSWTRAPHSYVMPERFVVLTINRKGEFKHLVAGNPLPPDRLIVGLDPEKFNTETFQYDSDGNLIVNGDIKWLTDFNDALQKGMAVTITLDEEDLSEGFEKVFVIGVRNSTPLQGKELLEKLIQNHHYIPEGAAFLPVNTPTNNSSSGESGFHTLEDDASLSFAMERNNESAVATTSDPAYPTDGERLAAGLGIDYQILNNLGYCDRTDVSDALNMNRALFPGTLGNFMEEALDTLFTLDNLDHTKEFMGNYVTARGFLPSVRIGTQPYGIMPTTAFSQFNATNDDGIIPELNKEDFENPESIRDELQTRYDIRLKELLNSIDSIWTTIRKEKVLYLGNTNPENPQAHFMEMLGLEANSSELFYRYGLNVASRQAAAAEGGFNLSFNSSDPWSPASVADAFRDIVLSGYYFKSDHFSDEQNEYPSEPDHLNAKFSRISDQFAKARVFGIRQLKDQSKILGDIVDSRVLADEVVVPSNPDEGTAEDKLKARAELQYFINWLVTQNPWDLHSENKHSEVSGETLTPGMPSKSLLFQLLRHSMLTAYADAILKILEFERLTDQETRKKMGQPEYYYNRFAEGFHYVTKWSYLFSKINRLNHVLGFEMNTSNGFYIYMNSLPNGYLNRYVSSENTNVFNNYPHHNDHQRFVDELSITRSAISKLRDIPTLRLEQLLAEHFDLCTYRLDSWKSGMVNKRLQKQRETNPAGIYLGAYGWVEDLKKGGTRTPAENIPDGLWKNGDDPVFTDADNLGFIHSPSLNHAITAAILRAGFSANSETAEIENQMAVNLSSERIRIALNLINAIRNGQDASAVLGYQFERGLHERYLHLGLELDEFIYDFRNEFPLSIPVDESVNLGEAKLTNVINGIDLLETAQDFIDSKGGTPNRGDNLYQSLKVFETQWWAHIGNANLSGANSAEKDAMLKEIDRIADSFDALGDLCVSESIYQVARGNHVRSSAIMDKLAKGDIPSDIEISDTPRTGTVVTHKVALFFEVVRGIDHELTTSGANSTPVEGTRLNDAVISAGAASAGWSAPFTPRAIAEPTLNKWVGEMIGDPAKIKCLVTYTIGDAAINVSVTLADLGIQPLDALHLFGTGPLDGGAELNTRIAMRVKSNIVVLPPGFEGTPDDAAITIKYTLHDASWADNEYSFYEKVGYFQSIRKLITDSAALAADSLILPGAEEVPPDEVRNEDVDEFMIRITNLNRRLELVQEDLNTFFSDEISPADAEGHTFTDLQIDKMRSLLVQASWFGIPGTIPDSLFAYSNAIGLNLIGACDGALKAVTSRLKQASVDIETAMDQTKSNSVKVKSMQEAGRKILGKAFVLLPHFSLRNSADVNAQLSLDADKGLLRAASDSSIEKWSAGIARVRERMAGLDTVQMWAENFGSTFPGLKIIQFPFELDEEGKSVDHWLGIEYPDGYLPTEDKLSIVLMNAQEIISSPDLPKAAMLIDEWVEIIPNPEETTGITFNYDQPDAKPPNNLLLAVTPKQTGHWIWDDLVYTLNDTLEMAKNRAVEPGHLENTVFGQILPGIMTEVVPPQLLPEEEDDTGNAQDNPLGLQVVTDFGVVNETYKPETDE